MISKFFLTNIISGIGIISSIMLAFLFSSVPIFIIGIVFVLFFHQTLYIYGMFSSVSNFFYKTIKGKEYFRNKEGILFRFDDGPDPTYTPRILDFLKSEGIKALFAVTGKNAEMYPEIVQRIHREEHIIANHTYSHPYNIVLLSYKRVSNEIASTSAIIERITGVRPKYFCSPMGHKNPIIGKAIKDLDLQPLMWDIRTFDTTAPLEKIMDIVKRKIKAPAIIMFHDAVMPWSKKDRESTVLALKETVQFLKEKKLI